MKYRPNLRPLLQTVADLPAIPASSARTLVMDATVKRVKSPDNLTKACDEGQGICTVLLTLVSLLLVVATLPMSLLVTVKVVQVGSLTTS